MSSRAGATTAGPDPAREQSAPQEQSAQRARDRRLLVGATVALLVLLVGGGLGVQSWRSGRAPVAVPTVSTVLAPTQIVPGEPIVLGRGDAPVRVQLYEDFRCPHCADFEQHLGPTVAERQQAGELAVELFPMAFVDQGSAPAANAMACAAESGFGAAYHQGLFANDTLRWTDEQLVDLAGKVSATVPEEFSGCVTGRAHQSWVDSINAAAATAGITSTPQLVLQGQPVDVSGLTPESLTGLVDRAAAS